MESATHEVCENCGGKIGALEAPCVWREQVVCRTCDAKLRELPALAPQRQAVPAQAPAPTPTTKAARQQALKQARARGAICQHCGGAMVKKTKAKRSVGGQIVLLLFSAVCGLIGLLSIPTLIGPLILWPAALAFLVLASGKRKVLECQACGATVARD